MLGSMKKKKKKHNKIGNSIHWQTSINTPYFPLQLVCTWWRAWWANRIKSHHVFSVWLKSQCYHFFSLFLPHVCLYSMIRYTHSTTANPFIMCIALHFCFCFAMYHVFYSFMPLFVFVNGRKNMRKMWMVNDARGVCVCIWNSHNHHTDTLST